MFACIIILTLYLAVPITLATAALFRPKIGTKTDRAVARAFFHGYRKEPIWLASAT